jgi:hypothetical protein
MFYLMIADAYIVAFTLIEACFVILYFLLVQYTIVINMKRIDSLLQIGVAVIVFHIITMIIKYLLKADKMKCRDKTIVIRDSDIIFTDRKGRESTVRLTEIERIKIQRIQMGYKATVYAGSVKFSFSSVETDKLPYGLKAVFRNITAIHNKFLQLLSEVYTRAPQAELETGILVSKKEFAKANLC